MRINPRHEIFKDMKSKDLQPKLLYPAMLSYKIEGGIKSFPDRKKLKEFVSTKPVLQHMFMLALRRGRRRKRKTTITTTKPKKHSLTIKWH